MKTAKEILEPYVERIFRHTEVVEKDNAIKAMNEYSDQFRLPKNMGWISMSDRKPDDYKRVIYFDSREKGEIGIGYFVWSQTPCEWVTHWMELPSHPK